MTHPITEKVISATDVKDGDTVYLTSCDAWTRDIAVAELLGADDVDWRLAFANRLREVTGATPVDAVEGAHGLAELAA
ncbi:MAG: DUF2849 domain-containing protein [Marinosulfonomonas sp.]|nr:DUF2849 domain-containing protein [Marinosulfonomonas sp.]